MFSRSTAAIRPSRIAVTISSTGTIMKTEAAYVPVMALKTPQDSDDLPLGSLNPKK